MNFSVKLKLKRKEFRSTFPVLQVFVPEKPFHLFIFCMDILFKDVAVEDVTISLVTHYPSNTAILFPMFLAMAEKRGVSWNSLRGSIQNDITLEEALELIAAKAAKGGTDKTARKPAAKAKTATKTTKKKAAPKAKADTKAEAEPKKTKPATKKPAVKKVAAEKEAKPAAKKVSAAKTAKPAAKKPAAKKAVKSKA